MTAIVQNSGYGRAILNAIQSIIPNFGRVFVVFNSTDNASTSYQQMSRLMESFDGKVRFFTSLSDANDATETNNNDVILLDSGATSHKVASMLTISNSKVHIVGMDLSGRLTNQRTLISNTSTGVAADVSMVKITGSGATFRNISFKNNWTVAQNLYAVHASSCSYPFFKNCTFHNLGSAHLTNANAAPLCIDGASDVELENCTIGTDTLKMTASGGQVLLITGATTRVTLRDCLIRLWTSQTNYTMVNIVGNGNNVLQLFRNCALINRTHLGVSCAVAAKSDATTAGNIVFDTTTFCAGCDDFATAAVGNTGMFIAAVVPTAGTSGIAVTPTA